MKKLTYIFFLSISCFIGCSREEHAVVGSVEKSEALVQSMGVINIVNNHSGGNLVSPVVFSLSDTTVSPGAKLALPIGGFVPQNTEATNQLTYQFSPELKKLPGSPNFDATNRLIIWSIPDAQPMSSFEIEVTAVYKNLKSKPTKFHVDVMHPGDAMLVRDNHSSPVKITNLSKTMSNASNSRVVLYGGSY